MPVNRLFQGWRPRVALDWTANTDIYIGATPTNSAYVDVPTTSQSFNVLYPDSLLLVCIRGNLAVFNGAVANEHASLFNIDGTQYLCGGGWGAGFNILGGISVYPFENMAVGSHTIKLQTFGGTGSSTYYCRASSLPNIESIGIRIFELPRRSSRNNRGQYSAQRSRIALNYQQVADLSGVLSATSFHTLVAAQTFTIEDPDSLLWVLPRGSGLASAPSSNSGQSFVCFDSDTSKRYAFGGDGNDTGSQASLFGQNMGLTVPSRLLGVGSHTARLDYYSQGAGNWYLRCTTLAPYENYGMHIVELK
jgi:hypothetical protein